VKIPHTFSSAQAWGEGRGAANYWLPLLRERAGVRAVLIKEGHSPRMRARRQIQVLRVSNDDVLKETEAVLIAILRAAGKEVD
jgi:hypothetical protein